MRLTPYKQGYLQAIAGKPSRSISLQGRSKRRYSSGYNKGITRRLIRLFKHVNYRVVGRD